MRDEKAPRFEDHKSKTLVKDILAGRNPGKETNCTEKNTEALYRHKKNIYDVYIDKNEYLR